MTRPAIPALLAGGSGFAAMLSADADIELSGGQLTGPMILAAHLAAMVLFGAMLVIIWKPRLGLPLTIAGLLLFAPWCSWLLAPGSWCAAVGRCRGSYPLVSFDLSALAILSALIACLWLQWPRRAP